MLLLQHSWFGRKRNTASATYEGTVDRRNLGSGVTQLYHILIVGATTVGAGAKPLLGSVNLV